MVSIMSFPCGAAACWNWCTCGVLGVLTVNYVLPGRRVRCEYSFTLHTMHRFWMCCGSGLAWELLGAVTIRTVKHSRTVLVVGEDFHRHREPGAFWQETGISKTNYGSQNQRETHFSELVFITVSLLIEETLKYWSIRTKVEGGRIKFSLHLSLNAVEVRFVLVAA